MYIFSIKNEKLDFFNRPIYCESSNEACSYIQNVLMCDADRALIGLKNDLALYILGEIDFVNGHIQSYAGTPYFERICSLSEIFDTIPEDKLKPALTRDDISSLAARVSDLEKKLVNHAHKDKGRGGVLIDV